MLRYLLVFTGLLTMSAQPAIAKPRSTFMGCTVAQIQSPRASACIDQMQKDIMAGYAYPHFVMCDATGMYCCQGDNVRTFNCRAIRATSPVKSFSVPLPGGLLEPTPRLLPNPPSPTGTPVIR